jgi:two-component system OmpR family response regulator
VKIRGRVLVIDGDEWLSTALSHVLTAAGWQVDVCGEARDGLQKACAILPDCIVCSIDLPDIDGFWVAARIRTEGGMVARTPFVFVGELADKSTRVQGLKVGADVVLERPISNDDVAAQIDALVRLTKRVRGETETSTSSISHAAAIRGDISLFPLASFLMMLEMERRTGTLDVKTTSGTRAVLTLAGGLFASTEVNGQPKPALDVLREVLSWRAGTFAFRPRDLGSMPPPRASVGALVLEAMRLEDEKKAMP